MTDQPNNISTEEWVAELSDRKGIEINGAREHNLKNIRVNIPRNKLTVITGVSGSGKSSLAFDTVYAEGQRRYMETFSSYARQFIGEMERPEVEQITGLSPVISIEQKSSGWNPRSTVGTITEVYDFLRLLFARAGEAYSHLSGHKMVQYTEEQIIETIIDQYEQKKVTLLAPVVRGRKGHYRELFEQIRKQGYMKVRVDGKLDEITPNYKVDRYKTHDIEVVIDRIKVRSSKKQRLITSIQSALDMGEGVVLVLDHETNDTRPFSKELVDPETGLSYEEPSPNTFSFNSPYGACQRCNGMGIVREVDMDKVIPDENKSIQKEGIAPFGSVRDNTTFKQLRALARHFDFSFADPVKDIPEKALNIILYGGSDDFVMKPRKGRQDFKYELAEEGLVNMLTRWHKESSSERIRKWAEHFMTLRDCPDCGGGRLKKQALHYKIHDKNIAELAVMDLNELYQWFDGIEEHLTDKQNKIASDVLKEIRLRLKFLLHVGLNYLHLNRPAKSLSGGESQRTRLGTQIGSQLSGITYILDEPSIGLHQRDNHRLIEALKELTEIGNTVIVVEHDKDIMLKADHIIDLGPGAGKLGGEVVAKGSPEEMHRADSLTAKYLRGEENIPVPTERRTGNEKSLTIRGARGHNLKSIDVEFPLGTFICVTGVSGSGKSTLINETVYPILRQHFYNSVKDPLDYDEIEGLEHLDKVIEVDQSPIGRTPRSNPATYTSVFTPIRKLFSELPESKIRGYEPGRFSFNVKGGRCEVCGGAGVREIEMNFLPNLYIECEECLGRRYNRETLDILYKGKNISDILDMTVDEATEFFENIPKIHRKLKVLKDVGLGYISLGQPSTTLSGGEAQRVKLSEELSKRSTGQTLYILDEPTTGLHFEDIKYLLNVLSKLVEKGNTVIVIEHNLDVIKVADHIIDLGKEGGKYGGELLFGGTPEELVTHSKESYTAEFLERELA